MAMQLTFLILGALLVLCLAAFAWVRGMDDQDVWAIDIYSGVSPLNLRPGTDSAQRPALSARDVTDAPATFVADPFLVPAPDGGWLMFLEVLNANTRRGEIAYASSADGLRWRYERLVLREPFHLSYPQVFRFNDTYFMIPETAEARSVRIYEATRFPDDWQLRCEIVHGNLLDATICREGGHWYLFALRDNRELSLHVAEELEGPWREHPASPVTRDARLIRPAGPVTQFNGSLLRFSQDGVRTYGHRVFATEILELTPQSLRERVVSDSPVLEASGLGWNSDGMHHIAAQMLGNGSWIGAVDGKFIRRRFLWRKAARAMLDAVGMRGS